VTSERGSVTIVMAGLLALALVLCLGAARLGAAVVAQARADAAADAAALAAADSLALDEWAGAALAAARASAAANGARLTRCACSGTVATVDVALSVPVIGMTARSTARAEVNEECRFGCS